MDWKLTKVWIKSSNARLQCRACVGVEVLLPASVLILLINKALFHISHVNRYSESMNVPPNGHLVKPDYSLVRLCHFSDDFLFGFSF